MATWGKVCLVMKRLNCNPLSQILDPPLDQNGKGKGSGCIFLFLVSKHCIVVELESKCIHVCMGLVIVSVNNNNVMASCMIS